MTEEEALALRETIYRRYPRETLELIQLAGGQFALRFVSGDCKAMIVWDEADWEKNYMHIKPVVQEEEEVL